MKQNNGEIISLSEKIFSARKKYTLTEPEDINLEFTSDSTLNFRDFDLFKQIEVGKARAEKYKNPLPYFRLYEGGAGPSIKYQNEDYLNFSSYNYLNFNGHKNTVSAVEKAVKEFGTSVSASRIVSGERDFHYELERQIADFYELEDSVVFVSGHAANVSVISTLFGVKDLILYDELAHNSILEGVKLSKAKAFAFKHNDTAHTEALLKLYRHKYEKAVIITEGLFSMDGDVPDLPKIIEVKSKYNSFLMVDEAHSLGVLGSTGRGISEYYKLKANCIDILMGTLSKTLCSCGGYIAGKKELIEILKYHAPGFVYSVGITPMNSAAALSSLKLLIDDNGIQTRSLQKIGSYFLNKLEQNGFDTGSSIGFGIIPLIIGGSIKTVALSNMLFKQYKINANPIIYPAVEEMKARLRFFINSSHSEEQIDYVVSSLASIKPK